MRDAARLSREELTLLLALTMRRAGQVWRRAEQAPPDSWLQYADRVAPELLAQGVRESGIGQAAKLLAGALPERKDITGKQAVVILADAIAAGFDWSHGSALALETADVATATLPAGAIQPGGSAAEGALYWSLVPRPEQPNPVPVDKVLKADPNDPGNLYRGVMERLKAAFASLPVDPITLGPALVDLLRQLDNVPVALADGRVAGMTDHILAAWPLAIALQQTLGAQLDSPSGWVAPDQPWWLLVGTCLRATGTPESLEQAAGLHDRLASADDDLQQAVATAAGRTILAGAWNAVAVDAPTTRMRLLLLPINAADAVQKAADGLREKWQAAGISGGIAGRPLAARDFTGADAAVSTHATQVLTDARDETTRGSSASFAMFAGPVSRGELPTSQSFAPPSLGSAPAPTAAADAPAIARPTLAGASPQGEEPKPDAPRATASTTAPPGVLVFAVADATSDPASLAAATGVTIADLSMRLRRHVEIAVEIRRAAHGSTADAIVGPGEWWIRATAATLPELASRLYDEWYAAWGHQPPAPLAVALSSGLVAATEPDDNPDTLARELTAARAALALARHASRRIGAGMVAWFPRHSNDRRACVPLTDLAQVARLGQHVLNLSGLRVADDEEGSVERLGRGHEWVANTCRRAANVAFPEVPGGWPGVQSRDARWRPVLSYSLNRYLGRRGAWSRKKAPPSPVDQLVDAIRANRWLGVDRPTQMDAALYLDLAGRWVDALRPTEP